MGVISDTHGLVRPEALAALGKADVILHAGDVGGPHVLQELGQLAPVIAVRGNVDTDGWARALPERRNLEVGDAPALLLHDRAAVGRPPKGVEVIVFGHSHQPLAEMRDGVLWFNPGSAGPKRFSLPICLGFLDVDGHDVRPRHVTLVGSRGG